MPARPILRWPHAVLRTPAAPVPAVTDEIRAIWADMIDTMEAMPGLGLAAPQIGVGLALAVVDCSAERGRAVRLANPQVVAASQDTFAHDEASPCLPGAWARLERPRVVTVRYLDDTGEPAECEFRDLWATSVQHQIDHLAGQLYFHRLGPVKRRLLLDRAAKAAAAKGARR